jgi:hypothetical protein
VSPENSKWVKNVHSKFHFVTIRSFLSNETWNAGNIRKFSTKVRRIAKKAGQNPKSAHSLSIKNFLVIQEKKEFLLEYIQSYFSNTRELEDRDE